MKKLVLGFCLLWIFSFGFAQGGGAEFKLGKGVNVPHTLAMTYGTDYATQKKVFQDEDAEWMVKEGYDHIRLPVEESVLFFQNMNWNEPYRKLLHETLEICARHDLKVVLVLYSTTGSHNVYTEWSSIFNDTLQEQHLYDVWKRLQDELMGYPTSFLAYEIINEPVAPLQEDWNRVLGKAITLVRKREPDRWIVAGSNYWQSFNRIWGLRLPEGDRRIIISFHYYLPFLLTHYGADFVMTGAYKGPVIYPGLTVAQKDMDGLDSNLVKALKYHNYIFTMDTLKKHVQEAVAAAKLRGLSLYCGEIGVVNSCPENVAYVYKSDLVEVLRGCGIPFAWWDYKGAFSIRK